MSLATELKALASHANEIVSGLKNAHPKLYGKLHVGGGEPGIVAEVANSWSHVANHWKPSFEIPHSELRLVENFAKGRTKMDEEVMKSVKKTVDNIADIGALSKHPELRRSAHSLQARLLSHEHQFHAPDYSSMKDSPVEAFRTMHAVRSHSLTALPHVIEKGEEHLLSDAYANAGGLTKEHRQQILDPFGVLMHSHDPQSANSATVMAAQHIQKVGQTILDKTSIDGVHVKALGGSLQDFMEPLRREIKLIEGGQSKATETVLRSKPIQPGGKS